MVGIRVMTIDDYDDVFAIWVNTPGMGLYVTDDSREGIERYLVRNPNTCFVAVCDGRIVGVIMAGHDGRRGFIHHTAVCPAYRKSGIATRLVDSATAALKEEGICRTALVVYDQNETGNAFWETAGFAVRTDLIYRDKDIVPLERIQR